MSGLAMVAYSNRTGLTKLVTLLSDLSSNYAPLGFGQAARLWSLGTRAAENRQRALPGA